MTKSSDMIPSSQFPFLSVCHDGKHKRRHNQELTFMVSLLRKAGISKINMHHVNDVGLDSSLPIEQDGKFYDIAYENKEGEIFLIELMRIKQPVKR